MKEKREEYNPCLACGACCAYFRVSFYWGECDDAKEGGVPAGLTEKLNDFRAVMKGTNRPEPRCIALEGEIGKAVRCTIYERRPQVCRDIPFSWADGLPEEKCDKSRQAWGLKKLEKKS
ncbi:MAG TPA: YkgJ family cysteine cluster protein [Desulfomonilia bacterium]